MLMITVHKIKAELLNQLLNLKHKLKNNSWMFKMCLMLTKDGIYSKVVVAYILHVYVFVYVLAYLFLKGIV